MASIQRLRVLSPWVIAVYVGLGAVMAAVSTFSDSPLDLEGGPLSFVDAFLIFVLAGLLLALSTYGEWRTPRRAGYLMGMVLALGVGIIQLVGLLDGDTPLVEELDTGNTLCWLISGVFLAWMLRTAQPMRSAGRLFVLGFILQSFSLVGDLTDGMTFELPDPFEWLFGPGEEISEVLFLASYCCGFALLINSSTAEASRWQREGLRAQDMLEPIAVIQRAHSALRWRNRGLPGRGVAALHVLLSPLRFVAEFAWQLWQNGRRIRRDFAKSWLRQAIEVVSLALSGGIPAGSYYKFDLFMPANRKLAPHFLHRREFTGPWGIDRLFRRLPGVRSPLGDRVAFAAHCRRHELPVVPVLAHGSGGKYLVFTPDGTLPRTALLARPNASRGGRGIELWRWAGQDYCSQDGCTLSEAQLLDYIARNAAEDGMILQPLRRNHPLLADLGSMLATVRIVTCLDESGRPEITHALLRMAVDENVSNDDFRTERIAAAIDLAEGRLGRATDRGLGDSIGWVALHPDSGALISGRSLPFWRETMALAVAAHGACLDRPVIGWDIVILPEGVELLGGDAAPDLDLIQRVHSRPLGLDRLGRLIAFHVRDSLR